MSAEAGEAFIYVGRKQRATPAEVQRVRELECERNGHSYEAVTVDQSADPQRFLCPWCSKSWRVVPAGQAAAEAELPDPEFETRKGGFC